LVKLVDDVLGRAATLNRPENRRFAEEQRVLADRGNYLKASAK
jgi:hypothetical protein